MLFLHCYCTHMFQFGIVGYDWHLPMHDDDNICWTVKSGIISTAMEATNFQSITGKWHIYRMMLFQDSGIKFEDLCQAMRDCPESQAVPMDILVSDTEGWWWFIIFAMCCIYICIILALPDMIESMSTQQDGHAQYHWYLLDPRQLVGQQ